MDGFRDEYFAGADFETYLRNPYTAWATYYTSPPSTDWAWILGMFLPTSVRLARIDLRAAADKARPLPAR